MSKKSKKTTKSEYFPQENSFSGVKEFTEQYVRQNGMSDGYRQQPPTEAKKPTEIERAIIEFYTKKIHVNTERFDAFVREEKKAFDDLKADILHDDYKETFQKANSKVDDEYVILEEAIEKSIARYNKGKELLSTFISHLDPWRPCKIASASQFWTTISWCAGIEILVIGLLSEPSDIVTGIGTGALIYVFTTPLAFIAGLTKREGNAKKYKKWRHFFNFLATAVGGLLVYIVMGAAWIRETDLSVFDLFDSFKLHHISTLGMHSYSIITVSLFVNYILARFAYGEYKDYDPDYYDHEHPVEEYKKQFRNLTKGSEHEIRYILDDTIKEAGNTEQWSASKLDELNDIKHCLEDAYERQFLMLRNAVDDANFFLRLYRTANCQARSEGKTRTKPPAYFNNVFNTTLQMTEAYKDIKKTDLQNDYLTAQAHTRVLTAKLQQLGEHHKLHLPTYLEEIRTFSKELIAGNAPSKAYSKQPMQLAR